MFDAESSAFRLTMGVASTSSEFWGRSRKERLYCFARQRGCQVLMASNYVSQLEDSEKFIVIGSEGTGSAPGHPVDGLVVR